MQSKKKKASASTPEAPNVEVQALASAEPVGVDYEIKAASTSVSTRTRGNRAAFIERTNRFSNIDDGLIPFHNSNVSNSSNMDVRDAVVLCQKAYYNFAVFRNTIDLMTEFSVGEIYLEKGSKKSREFFEALFKKINIWNFQDQFFREYYRSGNVFVYRLDYNIGTDAFKKFAQTFGTPLTSIAEFKIPARYMILNPADVQATGNISFSDTHYSKILTDYEIMRLRYPKTEQDRAVLEGLNPELKKLITQNNAEAIALPLDEARTKAVFYKKQDYEPFSVPLGFAILEDLNYKKELRKMDMAISRTMQQAVLLVTTGTEPEKGGVNPKNIKALQTLFQNESVGRVLIADYTTKAQFIIPQIADILDPKKYEILDRDIREGLGNILVNDEKFANSKIKLQVFAQKLNESRKAFLRDFLIPEMKRISKELGFKSCPVPFIQEIDLSDIAITGRIYNRLIELGVLTPEEGLEVYRTGRLPDAEGSIESQKRFKEHKEEGLYEPLIGGGNKKEEGEKGNTTSPHVGRPDGTSETPQVETTRGSELNFSLKKLVCVLSEFDDLETLVKAELRQKHGKKRLNKQQIEFAEALAEMIARNSTDTDQWNKETVQDFISNPMDRKSFEDIDEIAATHGLDLKMASLLNLSKAEKCQESE